jgi:hypothetical protein
MKPARWKTKNRGKVTNLMSEIKQASGLSNSKLATELNPYIDMTDSMISQYLAGQKTMSESRMFQVASAAIALGWETTAVRHVLLWEALFPKQESDEIASGLDKDRKSELRSKQAALAQFDKAIKNLVDLSWDDKDIVGMAITLTEKYIPAVALTQGGIVNPAWMREVFGDKNSVHYPDAAWLTWRIMGLEEASDYLRMQVSSRAESDVKKAPSKTT